MNAPTLAPEKTALATVGDRPDYRLAAPSGRDLILNPTNLGALIQVSELMANAGAAVPQHLRKNPGACLGVTMQAMRWNMDPFGLAIETYQIEQNPISYSGKAIIAALNNSALLDTRLSFKWDGPWERIIGKFEWRESKKKQDGEGNPKKYLAPTWGDKDEDGLFVIVTATLRGEKEPRELQLFLKQARVRNSPLWTEDPRQQLAYLAARRWGRLYAPDVIMGVYTPDEILEFEPPKDMGHAEVVTPQVPPELLNRAQAAALKGVAAYQEFWKGAKQLERGLLNEASDWHEKFKVMAAEADQRRTVSNAPAPAPTPAPSPAPTAASQADPVTGETTPPAGQQQGGDFAPTYANVMDRMQAAAKQKNAVALDVAADWISEVADPEQQKELKAKYDELRAEITQGAAQ